MSLSDSHHFRKMVAGACMVVAPVLFLAAVIVLPGIDTDAADYYANAVDHPDAWYISSLLALASLVVVVPAVLGLMHMLREREVAFGHVGGGFMLTGVVALAALTGTDLVVWQMTKGGDPAQMTALVDRFMNSEGLIPLIVGALLFPLGTIALFAGLVRAHATSAIVGGIAVVGAICFAVGYMAAAQWLLIVAAAMYVVSFGATGLMVLRETDADWEHTPEFRGFRPAAGTS